MKKLSFFILLVLGFSSCVSYKVAKYEVEAPIEQKIPNLNLLVIENNFETFYLEKTIRNCNDNIKPDKSLIPSNIASEKGYYIINSPKGFISKKQSLLNLDDNYSFSNNGYIVNIKPTGLIPGENIAFNEDSLLIHSRSPIGSNYYRLDFDYFGRTFEFQDKLISESKIVPYNYKSTKDEYVNIYKKILTEGCPSYAPNGKVTFHAEYYNVQSDYISDKLISDIKDIYNYEFSNNICNSNSTVNGYVVLKLLSSNNKNSGTTLYFIEALTLFTVNFIGVPLAAQTRDMTVQADIYSNNNELIASYIGYGNAKKYCAMYWGYSVKMAAQNNSNGSLSRATNSAAFYEALLDIKKQISNDAVILNTKLKE